MKRLFSILAGGLLLAAPSADAVTIYGYQTFEPMQDLPFRGPICFDSATPGDATEIADCSNMGVVYGGYYYNYRWYGQVIVQGTQSNVDGLYEIDMTTGERTLIAKGGAKMIDLTYDYSSDKVYGIRTGNTWFAEFDPATGESTLLGKFTFMNQEVYMLAIAASLDGTLYGISTDDTLYKIAKTGKLTRVGSLGVDAAFDQTMAFDHSDGTLYWANNADYTLYTVNTSTGRATAIAPIGKNGLSSMGSLFVPYINVAAGAPDRVTDVAASSTTSSATLTWTNPSITAQGKALTDFAGVRIKRDGKQVADIKRTASEIGKADTFTDTGLADETDYSYEIIPYNAAGEGGVDSHKFTVHTGKDRPGAVVDLKAVGGDGSAILSWSAPVTGATGGEFSPADVTGYIVSRNDTEIATLPGTQLTYEDKAPFGTYTYTVAAVSDKGTGPAAAVEKFIVKPADWVVMTAGTVTLDPGVTYQFYDEGGPNANYYNSRRQQLVVEPGKPNSYVIADFTEFSVDTYGDYLSVYNGNSTDEADLIGKFVAMTVPAGLAHIESTAADGCLTFLFYSDIMGTESGWKATLKSATRLANDLELTSLAADEYAVAGKETEYTVNIANKGINSADAYTVELLDGSTVVATAPGTALAPRASTQITVKHTFADACEAQISARIVFAADDNAANNASAHMTQTVLPKGSAFVDMFAAQTAKLVVMPMSFMSMESISQQLIPSDEVGAAKDLQLLSLSYPFYACETGYTAVPVTVWIGETTEADLSAGSLPVSQLTKVLDGTIDIAAGSSALTFTFAQPYLYKGGNLVVTVHKHMSPTNQSGVSFKGDYGYTSTFKGSRYDSHYTNEGYSPFDPEEPFGYSAQTMRPDIRMIFVPEGAGVDNIVTDSPEAAFTVSGTTITAAEDLTVYTVSGAVVARIPAGQSFTATKGIYIIASASGAVKASL